jgi:hypothetical protein
MMKKAIGVVLFFSMLAAPALAGGQSGGGSAPRSSSSASSGHVFTMPDAGRIEPVRTPVANHGPPAKAVAPGVSPDTKVKFPPVNRAALLWDNYTDHIAPVCVNRHPYDVEPTQVYVAYNCRVNPYYTSMFLDTNL